MPKRGQYRPITPRERVCQDCGGTFFAKRSDVTLCAKCKLARNAECERNRRAARRIGPHELTCIDCGKKFLAKRRDALRCETCKVHMHQEASRRYEARHAGQPHVVRTLCCKDCGQEFQASRSDALRCQTCNQRRRLELARISSRVNKYDTCPECGRRKFNRAERCSKCEYRRRGELQRGERNPFWKGGKTYRNGYIFVRNPDRSAKSHYRGEHDVVWEAVHGPLPKDWVVHHLNGAKADNRLENLAGMPNMEHHSHPRAALRPYEERIRQLEERLVAAGLPIN